MLISSFSAVKIKVITGNHEDLYNGLVSDRIDLEIVHLLDQLSTYGLKDDVIERCLPYSKQLPEDLKITKNRSS